MIRKSKRFIARRTRRIRQRLSPYSIITDRLNAGSESWKQMQSIYDRTGQIQPGDVLLLTLSRDENIRIPHFLQYYRDLGVDHFLFIDNLSEEPVADVLASEQDCSLWRTEEPFEDSHWSTNWLNAILPRYAVDHWVLNVDIDEYFVFPFMETRTLRELLAHLDDLDSPALFSLLIDMYPKGPVEEAVLRKGCHPLEVASYFDASGYYSELGRNEGKGIWVRGGPRMRVINEGVLHHSPALNKIPLVKWDKKYVSFLGTHSLLPKFLNNGHHTWSHSPTGALMHFKFLSFFREKVRFAAESENHFAGSREYKKYQLFLETKPTTTLYGEVSEKYINSDSLMRHNLLTAGSWV